MKSTRNQANPFSSEITQKDGVAYDHLKKAVNMRPRRGEDKEFFEAKKVESYYAFGIYWLDKHHRNESLKDKPIEYGEAYKYLKLAAERNHLLASYTIAVMH